MTLGGGKALTQDYLTAAPPAKYTGSPSLLSDSDPISSTCYIAAGLARGLWCMQNLCLCCTSDCQAHTQDCNGKIVACYNMQEILITGLLELTRSQPNTLPPRFMGLCSCSGTPYGLMPATQASAQRKTSLLLSNHAAPTMKLCTCSGDPLRPDASHAGVSTAQNKPAAQQSCRPYHQGPTNTHARNQ